MGGSKAGRGEVSSKALVWLLLCLVLSVSCGRSESASATPPRAPLGDGSPGPSPAPAASPCDEMLAEFDHVRDTANNRCASHEECTWAPAFTDCGRVTDRATATKMRELRQRALEAGCRGTVRCAKRAQAHAICADGRCVPGPPRSKGPPPPYVPSTGPRT